MWQCYAPAKFEYLSPIGQGWLEPGREPNAGHVARKIGSLYFTVAAQVDLGHSNILVSFITPKSVKLTWLYVLSFGHLRTYFESKFLIEICQQSSVLGEDDLLGS